MFKFKKFFFLGMVMLFWGNLSASAIPGESSKELLPVQSQQGITINGVVSDATGDPLPGVNVMIKGTTQGTLTDVDGAYFLPVANENATLVFSYVGFAAQEIVVGAQRTINIKLNEEARQIGEVVVTGYGGTQLRSKLINSISKVKAETLEVGVHADPVRALAGVVSGLRIVQTSGNLTTDPQIILRGGTNLDGTGAPLFVVDGIVRDNLRGINPADIESIDVLKDAGATAIYGARANNGVIMVTTKSGKSGHSEITVHTKIGLDYLNDVYKFVNARDFLYHVRSAQRNSAQVWQDQSGNWRGPLNMAPLTSSGSFGTGNLYWDPANPNSPLDGNKDSRALYSTMIMNDNNRFLLNEGWQSMIDPVFSDELIYKEFDWIKACYRNPAVTQDYNISLSGGNDKGHYYAGLGYNHTESLPYSLFWKNMTFVFNGDYKIKNWLTSFSNLNFSKAKYVQDLDFISEASLFGRVLGVAPTFRGTNADGEFLIGTTRADSNPQKDIDALWRDNNIEQLYFGQTFKFDILKNLSLKLTGNWALRKNINEGMNKDYMTTANTWNRTRSTWANYGDSFRQMYNAVATYDLSYAGHHLNILAGSEYFDEFYKYFSAQGNGAPTDDFHALNLTSTAENQRSISSSHWQERIWSFFGRMNYDYLEKYLLSFTIRRDGYSKLLNNRWSVFPGISAGWVFSKESFMKSLSDIVSFAKLRTSYGLNGNVSGVGTYELQGSFSRIAYNGNTGYSLGNLPNYGLRWERSNTFETGLDISFLENRINTNFTWFYRETIDKFANIPLPGSSGITSIRTNNGSLSNKGVELDINFRILERSDWKWGFDLTYSFYKNKILQLPDNGLERNRQNAIQVYSGNGDELIWIGGYQEGQRPGDLYAFKSEGVFKTAAEVAAIAGNRIDKTRAINGNGLDLYGPNHWNQFTDAQKATGMPIEAGDMNWKDVNEDGVIDQFDLVYMGNVFPKAIGGFRNNISWKGIALYARFDYALGHVQHDLWRGWLMNGMAGNNISCLVEVKDTWSPENPNGKLPKFYIRDDQVKRNYYRGYNSIFVYKGDYLCIRELQLSYDLKKEWLQKIGSSGIQLSVTGQNLGYITKSKTYNPENTTGTAYNSISGNVTASGWTLPRTVVFGALFKF